MDTIFALASGQGRAGVAVLRVSGPKSRETAELLCGVLPEHRRPVLRKLVWADEVLDECLVLHFAAGASFTGEETVEFHLHGSLATVRAVLRVLGGMNGMRQAESGEFTRRALENGRLDLTQVEGLADLIDAETEAQRRQALRIMSGDLGRKAEDWRRSLIRAAALIEATIDFVDEDVPIDVVPEVLALIADVQAAFRRELEMSGAAERIRSGFEVAIVGAPNAGKSTLLNALAGREAAITSEVAGTTRDIIEVRMDIAGLAVTVLDTAGLREATDLVEKIGVERARARAVAADLRVFLTSDGFSELGLDIRPGDIVLRGKADLIGDLGVDAVSGKTGQGVDRLLTQIGENLSGRIAGSGLLIRERHRQAMVAALDDLNRAESGLLSGGLPELVAADIRYATRGVESLVGKIDVENLLDEIFSSFCIGK